MATQEDLRYRLDVLDEQALLQRVEPEVVSTLGEDRVFRIEDVCTSLEYLEGISSSPNPFNQEGRGVDLSFLKSSQLTRVKEFALDLSDGGERYEKMRSMGPLARALLHNRLLRTGETASGHCWRQIEDVQRGLESTAVLINGLLSGYSESEGTTHPDLEAVAGYLKTLEELSRALPSKGTMDAVTDISQATSDSLDNIHNRIQSLHVLTLAQILIRDTEKMCSRVKALREYWRSVGRFGHAEYESVRAAVKLEQCVSGLELLEVVEETQSRFVRDPAIKTESDAALKTEAYLTDRTAYAERVIGSIDRKILEEPRIQRAFERLEHTRPSNTKRLELDQERIAQASGFSNQVTEARDILRGGGRLRPSSDLPQPRAKADSLHDLALEDGTRLLEPEESGVIIAIISNRFTGLLGVLERVHSTGGDEVLETVEGVRPDVIRTLRGLNLKDVMTQLSTLLNNQKTRQILMGVLTPAERERIEQTLAEFYRPETIAD